MSVALDTDQLPPGERAEALQESFRNESPQRVVFVGDGPVHHRIDLVDLGRDMHLRRDVGSPLHVTRDERHVRLDAPEFIGVGLQRGGRALLSAGGGDIPVGVGHLHCVDVTGPYALLERGVNWRDDLILSNREAGVSVDVVRAAAPHLDRSPLYDLVRTHLAGLFAGTKELPPPARLLTGQATAALVRALLLTAAEDEGGPDALADTLETRVLAYIDVHLGDQKLAAGRIAAASNISVRHLYNVWARSGHDVPLSRWIQERRLDRARDDLADVRLSISDVAARWGFADASHFGRRFREQFDVSPGEWRVAHHVAWARSER